jgi:type I restriction enzyme M protein
MANLLPWLRNLRDQPGASPKQKVISEIVSSVERVRVDTEANFADVLDRVHALQAGRHRHQHQFMLSQVYEGLLLKMGEKNSDGGQFYTPRELIRAMVQAVNPRIGRDRVRPLLRHRRLPGRSGRAHARPGGELTTEQLDAAQAPHLLRPREGQPGLPHCAGQPGAARHRPAAPVAWQHAVAQAIYDGLWEGAPERFHVVLTNPPFRRQGRQGGAGPFPFKTRATQVLFVQYVMQIL